MNAPPLTSALKYLQAILFSAVLLYFGKALLIPLFFGLLIAIVMYPMCKWLEGHLSKALAIAVCLFIVTILFIALVILLSWQLNVFSTDVPALLNKIKAVVQEILTWIKKNIGETFVQQDNWVENLTTTVGGLLKATLQTTVNTLFILFLTPVYTAPLYVS